METTQRCAGRSRHVSVRAGTSIQGFTLLYISSTKKVKIMRKRILLRARNKIRALRNKVRRPRRMKSIDKELEHEKSFYNLMYQLQ